MAVELGPSVSTARSLVVLGAGADADALGAQPATIKAKTPTSLYNRECPRSIRSPSTRPVGGSAWFGDSWTLGRAVSPGVASELVSVCRQRASPGTHQADVTAGSAPRPRPAGE